MAVELRRTKTRAAHSRAVREAILAYGLLAPAVLLLLVFTFFPVVFGFAISLYNWRIVPRNFIGFQNYATALQPGSDMWNALGTTISYTLLSVPIQLFIALILATLLFQKLHGKSFFRVALFLPYVTSTVASAAVWARLYSPDIGLINQVLRGLHLQPLGWLLENRGVFTLIASGLGVPLPAWLTGPSLALVSIVVYTTWVFVGYDMTIFLAGLGNIPTELYEAARIDGAGGWDLFRRITLPLLSPTTFFLSLITVIGVFKAFNHIWVMTRGDNGTTTASILIYRQMYEFQLAGYASALAFLLFTVILIITVAQYQLAGRQVNY